MTQATSIKRAMPQAVVTRFAPSPTGYLHLGHVRSALEGLARGARGGRAVSAAARRYRPRRAAARNTPRRSSRICAWLGLDWDGPIRRQSEHFADYRAALTRLDAHGPALSLLLHAARDPGRDRARRRRAAREPEGVWARPIPAPAAISTRRSARARRAAAADYALRLDVGAALARTGPLAWCEDGTGAVAADPAALGDVVLARKEMPTSYHLAVTVDDALQGVTLVTRGVDLFAATHIHRLLQALLGLPTPRYRHHTLLTDAHGRRLAKRDKALTIRAMRESADERREVLEAASRD